MSQILSNVINSKFINRIYHSSEIIQTVHMERLQRLISGMWWNKGKKLISIFTVAATLTTLVMVIGLLPSFTISKSAISGHLSHVTNTSTPTVKYPTLCTFIKQFKLSKRKSITVCNYQGKARIDIRLFINDYPSIRGIWISKKEWHSLLTQWNKIQHSLSLI